MTPRNNTIETLECRRLLAAAILPAFVDKMGLRSALDPTPTFADEFSGSSLDGNKWQIREGPRWRPTPNSSEFAWTGDKAIKVRNGNLELIAHTDSSGRQQSAWIQTTNQYTGKPIPGLPTPKLMSGRSANFEQKFGYWEARLKFDSVSGMWGAFWVHSAKMVNVGNDPKKDNRPEIYGTEMDVAEVAAVRNGAGVKNEVSTVIHASGYGDFHRAAARHTNVQSKTGSSPASFHVYGLMWTDKSVSFYLDGNLVHRETDPELISKIPQMTILSNEIGAPSSVIKGEGRQTFGKIPEGGFGSITTSKAKLTADYVRVWKLKGSSGPTNPTNPPTNPNPTKASISGVVFNDTNNNGRRETSEKGLFGKTVYIDANRNNKLDTSEKRTTTDANGAYTIDGLNSGSYTVRQVLSSGARQTSTTNSTLTLGVNGKATLHFGTYTAPVATPAGAKAVMTGSVYIDRNGNGIRDGSDTAIANVLVYLDANNNGKRDANERTSKTTSNGGYRFDNVAAGANVFRLDLANTGYKQTFPLDNAARKLDVKAGKTYSHMNFRARRA